MPIEWVRVVTDAVRIHIWKRKSLLEIFYPYVVAGIALFALAWKKMRKKAKTINAFMGITLIVAALYSGSGLAGRMGRIDRGTVDGAWRKHDAAGST